MSVYFAAKVPHHEQRQNTFHSHLTLRHNLYSLRGVSPVKYTSELRVLQVNRILSDTMTGLYPNQISFLKE